MKDKILPISTLLTCLFVAIGCTSEQLPAKPNIIYILADDLGYGELGSYGQQQIETPNIDRLASEGMRFTQHYAGAPVCAPSRCVLLTGKHLGHAYIRGNDAMRERGDVWNFAKASADPNLEGQRPIPANTVTIGKLLQNAGYTTACIGKWGLGGPFTEGNPNKQGFDFFFGYNCQRQAHTYYPLHLWKNDKKVKLANELVVPGTKLDSLADPYDPASYQRYRQPEMATDLMLTEALEFIDQNKEHPFFLLYATPLPHVPLQAPEKWITYYQQKFGEEEPYLGNKGYFPNRTPKATYAAMISYLDEQIGALLTRLEEHGLAANTIIMFSSDNGPTYAGGADPVYFNSAGPFKGAYGWGKGFVNEGGIRVPFIVRWPGQVQPKTTTDLVSAFYDVLPTLCDLVDIPEPDSIDGISMLPTLLGKGKQQQHEFLYWDYPEYDGQQAVRLGKWKGIRKNIKKGNLTIELYDLENDIEELHNVAADNPEIVAQIAAIMQHEHTTPRVATFRMAALDEQ